LPIDKLILSLIIDFSTIIIIDNLPVVNQEKAPKLKNLLMKIYTALCEDVRLEDLYFPFDEATQMTPGYIYKT
jgi:hypothetical protein